VIRGIVPSDEPSVVLSSLARSSNPSFSDACTIELSEGTGAHFQVSFPMPEEAEFPAGSRFVPAGTSAPPAAGKTIVTAFKAVSGLGYPSFAGMVVHSWADRDPTEADAIIARLLVDLALAILHRERLARSVTRADSRAAKLAIDLITSRIEGEATGILMAEHQIRRGEAVGMLRRMSRASQRQLHEVAAGVVQAADLQRLAAAAPAIRPGHLHVAASHGYPAASTACNPARPTAEHCPS
jgi:ANTAR domain